jgi:hypothetical protein
MIQSRTRLSSSQACAIGPGGWSFGQLSFGHPVLQKFRDAERLSFHAQHRDRRPMVLKLRRCRPPPEIPEGTGFLPVCAPSRRVALVTSGSPVWRSQTHFQRPGTFLTARRGARDDRS